MDAILNGMAAASRQSDGTTIAGQYARLGINLRPANTDRINGWAEVSQCLLARILLRLGCSNVCGHFQNTDNALLNLLLA